MKFDDALGVFLFIVIALIGWMMPTRGFRSKP